MINSTFSHSICISAQKASTFNVNFISRCHGDQETHTFETDLWWGEERARAKL